jgi:hypothetical protein
MISENKDTCKKPVASYRWFDLLSTLKMEAICCSETPGVLRTTRKYNAEGRILHGYRGELFKSSALTILSPQSQISELIKLVLKVI